MSDMKVAVRPVEPGLDMVIYSFRKIFINFPLIKSFWKLLLLFPQPVVPYSQPYQFPPFRFFNNMPVHPSIFSISAVFPFPAGSDIELL